MKNVVYFHGDDKYTLQELIELSDKYILKWCEHITDIERRYNRKYNTLELIVHMEVKNESREHDFS